MIIDLVVLVLLVVTQKWPFGMSDNVASIIIPTVSSIIVFALGWIITVIYNVSAKRRAISSYRRAVFEWTDLVIQAVQKQVQSLKVLSEKLASAQSIYPEPYEFARSMSDKLKDLSAERVISVFIENCRYSHEDKRAKYSYNLISQYDFLSSIEGLVKGNYEAYNNQANALRKQWNRLWMSLLHEMDAVRQMFPQDFKVGQYLREIIDSFVEVEGQVGQMDVINAKLIKPLIDAVDYCKKAYPEVRCYQPVYVCIDNMALLYKQWFGTTRSYSDVFSKNVSTIETSLAALQEAINYFKNSTRVAFWVR